TCTAPNTINMKWIHRATAENRLSPVDMTKNVNLRKQTHFEKHAPFRRFFNEAVNRRINNRQVTPTYGVQDLTEHIKSLDKPPDSQKEMTSPTAENRPPPAKRTKRTQFAVSKIAT
ncbi:MAG: hypothetical protein V3V99_10165, partial [candidate division Zixibacteria bacterium]